MDPQLSSNANSALVAVLDKLPQAKSEVARLPDGGPAAG